MHMKQAGIFETGLDNVAALQKVCQFVLASVCASVCVCVCVWRARVRACFNAGCANHGCANVCYRKV